MKNTFKRILTLALVVMMLIGCIPTGVFAEEAVALPSATITSIEEPGYTYAFDVKVPEPTFDQNVAYAGWEADFELTFNKDIKLNADRSANGFVAIRNGVIGMGAMSSAPATDVILEAGQSLKILDYINLMNGGTSDKPNFLQVFTYWKDFQFGIFLDQKYLEANPDFNATLELKLYNPENGEATVLASQVVGKADLPTATITKVENKDLTFAMKLVADDATAHQLSYYGNWYADFEIKFNKQVTFNANGGKDGYLSGEYGEWGWINAPIEDVTLNANEVLKVMEYAAEMKGEPGLKYTYKEVVEVVKEFNCGVFFEPAFLAANPDIIATVVLKIYNPTNEEENYQIGNTFTFGVPELPTATTNGLEKDELTFGMEFKADAPTAEQLAFFGKWFADFEITVNKDVVLDANGTGDGYLSGQYDGEWVDEDWAWRGEWLNVPFNEVVTLEANKPLKIMAFAAEMLNEPGLKYTYKEAVEVVKNFKCGAYFTPEFLQANPDLRVTLELRIYNPADENVNYLIGETYVFENSFVAYNVETNKHYKTVSAALSEAVAGQTVRLIKNATDSVVMVLDGVTLDLNGYKLEAQYVFATGNIVDDSTSNNGRIKAALKMVLSENNRQLPVRDANGEVAFYEVLNVVHAIAEKTETSVKYAFQTKFEAAAHEALLAGQATTGVKIVVRATWTRVDGTTGVQDFVYNDSWTEMFINSYVESSGKYGKMFTLVLDGYQNYENLQYQAYVISDYTSSFTVDKATTQEVNLTNEEGATAVVPSGAILSGSEKNLALKVAELDNSASNIVLEKNEVQKSVDVHVAGISENNTVPVIVTVKGFAEAGLNDGNLKLYHVEKGKTNLMTQVSSLSEVDKHNEFYYDVATGDVTMALATFSEIAVVSDADNPWNGEADTTWYDAEKDYFEIFNANQLAGLGELVDGGVNFYGKTVKMCMDVNLFGEDDKKMLFNPIGYGYKHQGSKAYFAGTFDGNGNTIKGLYQQGWDMEAETGEDYTYSTAGGGLFASIYGATIKNLTMDNAYVVMECIDMGVVVGYAQGNCTFENIIVKNSTIANYNRSTGGVIGEVTNGHHTLKNVDVANDVVISALWGTFDPAIGGLIGGRWSNGTSDMGKNGYPVSVEMDSCDVAAKLDVYNDVTSAYQWYSYRRAGMLIGNTEYSEKDASGRTEATAPFLTTVNCTVSYGDWAKYTYCEFGNEYYPFVRVQAGHNGFNGAYSNARYGLPKIDAEGNLLDPNNHVEAKDHVEGEAHHTLIVFNQLYGGGQGCYGGNYHVGKGVTILDAPELTTKFESSLNSHKILTGSTIKLGNLFAEAAGVEVKDNGVFASASPVNKDVTARASFNNIKAGTAWEDMTLTFTGTGFVEVTINDYYYCTPTKITLEVVAAPETPEDTFVLIDDEKDLFHGAQIVVAAKDSNFAMSTVRGSDNFRESAIEKNLEAGTIIIGEDVQVLFVELQYDGTYTLSTSEGYLYAASNSDNQLKVQSTVKDNGKWNIDIDSESYKATVRAKANTRNLMCYNPNGGDGLFSCYLPTNPQNDIVIYLGYGCKHVYDDGCDIICNKCNDKRKIAAMTDITLSGKTYNVFSHKTYSAFEGLTSLTSNMELESNVDFTGSRWGFDCQYTNTMGFGKNPWGTDFDFVYRSPYKSVIGNTVNIFGIQANNSLAYNSYHNCFFTSAVAFIEESDKLYVSPTTAGLMEIKDVAQENKAPAVKLEFTADTAGNVVLYDTTGKFSGVGVNKSPYWANEGVDGWLHIEIYHNDTLLWPTDGEKALIGISNTEITFPNLGVLSVAENDKISIVFYNNPAAPDTRAGVFCNPVVAYLADTVCQNNHSYDNACDVDCGYCGKVRDVPGHIFGGVCDSDCNVCGEKRTVTVEHSYTGVCDTSCDVCGTIRKTAVEHTYSGEGDAKKCDTDCDVCHTVRRIDHKYDNSCDTDCNYCGYIRTTAHYFANPCDAECNSCGFIRDVPDHVYDNDCDEKCNNCSAVREVEHPDSNKDYLCDICNKNLLDEVVFEFGANGSTSHYDGSEQSTYTETNGDYTLNITGGNKMYTSARDAKGKSCIKLGTNNNDGSFTFTVPDNITKVIIAVAKYKDNASTIIINGTTYTLTKNSDNSEYDLITIDTSTTKTVTVATDKNAKRAMINSITFVIAATEAECVHANQTTTTVDATCTEAGSTTVTCDDCGETISTEAIEASGHKYGDDDKCTVCGETDPDATTQPTWQLVTDASALKAGDQIVIVAKDHNYALSTTQNSNNRGQASVTKNGDTITFGNDVQVITLEAGKISGTFALYTGTNGYLYAPSSSSNHLKTKTTLDDNGSWLITISAEGIATIKAQGTNTRNWLRYNATNNPPIFSAYGSGQTDICLYVKVEGETGGEEPEVPACQHTNTTTTTVDATCTKTGSTTVTCDDCGETVSTETLPVIDHNYVDGVCSVCGKKETTTPVEATLSFANIAQRTSFSTTKQVWEQNGIIFTNEKNNAQNNVADYVDPVRCYKGSSISITAPGAIKTIVFECKEGQSDLKNAIPSGATANVSGTIVTVELNNLSNTSFNISNLSSGKVFIYSITVTYME